MKHLFKYSFLLVIILVSTISTTSCSKDDDGSSSNPFVGVWIYTPVSYYGRVIEFNSNNTAKYYNVAPDGQYETVTSGWKRCSNIGTFSYVQSGSTLVTSGGDTYYISGSKMYVGDQEFRKIK